VGFGAFPEITVKSVPRDDRDLLMAFERNREQSRRLFWMSALKGMSSCATGAVRKLKELYMFFNAICVDVNDYYASHIMTTGCAYLCDPSAALNVAQASLTESIRVLLDKSFHVSFCVYPEIVVCIPCK
jgi:hypothetical protein